MIKFQVPQVSRRAAEDRYLHLIAFIIFQTYKLHDTLIDTLLFTVQSSLNIAQKSHKESYYQDREQREQKLFTLANRLGQTIIGTVSAIKLIIADGELNDSQKVAAIGTMLSLQMPKEAQLEHQIDTFKQNMATVHCGQDYYDLLEQQSLKLQNRVAEIVRQVQFESHCSEPEIFAAVLHYQDNAGAIDKHAPIAFLSQEARTAVIGGDGKFRLSLYKVLLYLAIVDAIKSGSLNLVSSEEYRSLDDYLIPKFDWDENRAAYLSRAQLEQYIDCGATLQSLNESLDAQYEESNSRFFTGEYLLHTLRANGNFHVSTPKLEEP